MSNAVSGVRSWSVVIVSVVLGVVLVGLGAWFVQPEFPQSGPIECGAEIMGPGDRCAVTGGNERDFTYESELASRQAWLAAWRDVPGDEVVGWSFIGLGLLGGVAGSIAGARRGDGGRLSELTRRGDLWIVIGLTVFSAAATFAIWVGPGSVGPGGPGWVMLVAIVAGFFTFCCVAATIRGIFVAVLDRLDSRTS